MNNYIVTTTINEPTEATLRFCSIAREKNWNFVIVGDLNTPHSSYQKLVEEYSPYVTYLEPEKQSLLYEKLSDLIGWKTIQRRNIGFLYAYHKGANIVATVDDDNIPYSYWGDNLLVGKEVTIDLFEPEADVFDPLSITKHNHIWHRGYPIELLQKRHSVEYKGKTKRKVLVQADLWDGDPDIDAIARLVYKPIVKFDDIVQPYCSSKISPFNSQNTFLSREVIPYYSVLPFVGRMDDIWGSYILQHYFPNSVAYAPASVYQNRNPQCLVGNLSKEVLGYKDTLSLVSNLKDFAQVLPEKAANFYDHYRSNF